MDGKMTLDMHVQKEQNYNFIESMGKHTFGGILYLKLGQQGIDCSLKMGSIEIANPLYVEVAHTPNVVVEANDKIKYSLRRNSDSEVMEIEPPAKGTMLSLSGNVPAPEMGVLEDTTFICGDPYAVRVGMANGEVKKYSLVPEVLIKF